MTAIWLKFDRLVSPEYACQLVLVIKVRRLRGQPQRVDRHHRLQAQDQIAQQHHRRVRQQQRRTVTGPAHVFLRVDAQQAIGTTFRPGMVSPGEHPGQPFAHQYRESRHQPQDQRKFQQRA
jgi:hypothetical protein